MLLGALLLGSCEYPPPVPPVPGHVPKPGYPGYHGWGWLPGQPGGSIGTSYYQSGYNWGGEDARRGWSRNASRHWASVPVQYRGEFTQGYSNGYQSNAYKASGAGYYSSGISAASSDRRRGLSYSPSRHWGSVPPKFRDEFSRGYAAGWNY